MREARGGTQGAQWLVTLGLGHHWARRQVSPTSLAFGESSSFDFLGIFWDFFGHLRHFFGHFWTIFGPFLGQFGAMFGQFLGHFLTPEKSFF